MGGMEEQRWQQTIEATAAAAAGSVAAGSGTASGVTLRRQRIKLWETVCSATIDPR